MMFDPEYVDTKILWKLVSVYQSEKASSFCSYTAVVISSLINFLALATELILSKTVLCRDDRCTG
jgi:hypothetical protein